MICENVLRGFTNLTFIPVHSNLKNGWSLIQQTNRTTSDYRLSIIRLTNNNKTIGQLSLTLLEKIKNRAAIFALLLTGYLQKYEYIRICC
jgi:hypothetical protein